MSNRRFLLFLLGSLISLAVSSQTLYWVGGNGNFSDPLHWSYSFNGPAANTIPNGNSDVVFTDGDGNPELKVNIAARTEVNSVTIKTYRKISFVNSLSKGRLVIKSSFDNLLDNQNFDSDVITEFSNSGASAGFINSGNLPLSCDFVISSGKWIVNKIRLNFSHSLYIQTASVEFKNCYVSLGNLDLKDCGALKFDHSVLQIYNDTKITNSTSYSFVKAYFNGKLFDDANAPSLSSIAGKGSSNQINSLCVPTPSITRPTCSPGCDGVVTVTLPAYSCFTPSATPMYQVLVSNNGCPGTPAGVVNVGPGVHNLTNFCACGNDYIIFIQDGNGNTLEDPPGTPLIFNVAVTQPGISSIPPSGLTVPLNCNGVCNGTVNISFFGGVAPYNFTITPPGGPVSFSTTGGALNLNGLCAGTLTVNTQDNNSCVHTFIRNYTQPAALNTNSVLANVPCNSGCNGGFTISPTGGTPNYTVAFSNGSNFNVGAGGVTSITGLCTGAYSATLTDSKSCSVTTSGNITQPLPLGITFTQTGVTCFGACTGAATVLVTGGVTPYQFTITAPSGVNSFTSSSSSINLTNLCGGGGNYTISVLDNNNCPAQLIFNISAPPAFLLSPTFTNVSCNNIVPCDGRIVLSPTGGNGGPYSYTWAPGPITGQGTATVSALCANVYSVTVTDGLNCPTNSVITITQPPAITITAVSQSVSCFGTCNGSTTLTPVGGNGMPYTYTWTPNPPTGQNTAIVSNLCGGTSYTATVRDAALCSATMAIAVAQASSITPNMTTTSITCNGSCNGVINAVPSGTAAFNYTLVSSAGTTLTSAPPYTGLCAANYTLFIQDLSSNCVQSFTTAVLQPNPLLGGINTTSISCFNQCNGSVAGVISGGMPGYILSWMSSSGTPTVGASLTGLCAGSYTLTVTDANGCINNTTTATLLQPSDFTVTVTPTNATCFNICNGALAANISGATPGYNISWSNGSTSNPVVNLCDGTYTLTVTDALACTRTVAATITEPTAISMTQATTAVSCSGGANGSATVTASGGTPPFTFLFNNAPPTTNTTGIVSGLPQGSYLATATDANGCNQSIAFNISAPPVLSAAITGSVNSCNVCTGAATVTAAGGTPPYISYAWTNSVGLGVGSGSVATALCPGDYTVTVTDNNLCTTTQTVHIALTVNISIVTGGTNIQCFGMCTGSAVASPAGGAPPYSYLWSPGTQTTQTAVNLCAGSYVVQVIDLAGCSNTAAVTITQPTSITATSSQTNATCFGSCNGAITTNVSGGTGVISYSWSPSGATTPGLSGVCAGSYTLQVRDANLCSLTLPVITITENAPITATLVPTNPSACLTNNGNICATPGGGTGGPYSYTWAPVAGNANCLNALTAGGYTVTIGDGPCTATFVSSLSNPIGPTLTVASQTVSCFGGNNGSATVNVAGISPFNFTWTPAVTSVSVANSTTATGLSAGVYVISAVDGNSCITTQAIPIIQPSSITVNPVISDVTCNGLNTGSITATVSGGTPAYSYAWLPSGPNASVNPNLGAGGYTLTVTDANLCLSTQFTFTLNQPPVLTMTSTGTNVTCNAACNGSIVATASGGTGLISYSWTPVGAFSGSTTATVLNLCPNIYTVTATDASLCSVSNTIQITEPPVLTSTLVLQNASCSNSCNAIAVHLVSGGTPGYAYSWVPVSSTLSSMSGLCAGNYTATIIDANGCAVAKGFTVTPPAPLNISLVGSDPKCNAVCNGSIATTVSGAQGSVSYNWQPAGSGQNPTGLCFGTYTVTAVDANTCEATAVVTLINPPALLANVSTTNASCASNCNGAALSTPINATGAVSYTWQPAGPNAPSITNLCSGTYTIHIKDAADCEVTQTFTLTEPPVLVVNPSTNPSTCGSANGVITATAIGGTPSYSYNWLPPISSTNATVTGLAAGIYTLVVTDANNCTNTVAIPLGNSNGPGFAPIISTSLNCNAQCTGAASVDVSGIVGGLSPYTVSWLPPAPSAANPLTNLCAGNYSVQVMDANNCILFTGVNILEPPPVLLAPTFGLPTCNGTCDGSLSLNPSGGMGPSFNYTWFPSGPNAPTLINACAGGYTVLIGDNGCTYSQSIVLPAQLNIMVSTSVTTNQCFGDCNATATAFNANGGVPPFTFNWSNGQFGPTATNLCNGTYSVTVTDANGCFNTFNVVISSSSQITTTTSVTSPSCGLCNGASSISASGGNTPYTFNWTTGSTASNLSNLCAGVYQVVVTDNIGCSITETIIVNSSTGITGENINVQGLPCAGTCDGAATVTAVGGTAPISYNWISPATNGSTISNLCDGTYYIQMIDAQGCMRTSSVVIDPVVSLILTPFLTPPGCGLSNGAIDVLIAGGSFPYTVSWNPPVSATASVTNVGQGSYTITVTEGGPNNCSLSQQINVSNANGPVINSTQTNINCFNACTGIITTTVTGTGPFTYNWSVGGSTPALSNLCKGVVTLSVTDANNCVTIESYTITDNPQLLSGLPTVGQPSCGLCNGTASLNVFGGVLPYTYTWTTGATGPGASALCAGLYQVQITDNLGCQQTETVVINNSNGITGETFNIQGLPCAGTCDGGATVTAIGGNAPITYNWVSPAVTGSVLSNLCSGTYFVQMSDAQGCIRTSSVAINPATILNISPSITPPGCGLSNGGVSILISGGTPTYAVVWNPAVGTTTNITGIGQGSYTVTVTESGPNNCSLTQQINVSNTNGPTVTATQLNINCFNACTGIITTTVAGTGPFTYNWSVGGNTSTVSNLCKGVITLSVTDGNNCVTIESYTITDNPQLQAGLPTVTQPSCGLCNGTANLNAFGGVSPYTYTWTTGANGPSASALCAGLYQVQITDNLGCQQTETVVINNSNGITGETFNVQGLPCAGTCNGAATVTAIGGNAPINYSWINPATSGPVITGLCDGTYFVQMSDAQGCIRTSSVLISPVTTLNIVPTITAPGCGLSNGGVSIFISGGTPAYAISWNPAVGTTTNVTGISQGSYTVTVTESGPNNCSLTQQINVSNTNGPLISASQTNIACFNACTGIITATATGTGPFTYNWSVGGNTSTVSNLCKGVVTLSVTDGNNCVTISSFTVTDNPQIQTGLPTITQPSCGLCNGTASLNAFGGVLPYTYTWTTGATGPGTSGLCAGLYQVQVIDNLGCQQTETVIINNSNGITGETFSVQGLPCNGTCNGAATVTAVGGTAPISYNWVSPPVSGPMANNLCAGTYFVQMTDAQGCIRTSSVDIDAVTTLSISTSIVEPGCQLSNGSINVFITGGTPTYAVSWSPAVGTTTNVTGIGQGSYTVTVTESGPNNCSLTQQINVSNTNGPVVSASQTNIACFGNCSGMLAAAVSSTASPFAYNWSVGGNAPAVTNLCSGVITLSVTDANNCVSIESYTIIENPPLQTGVPLVIPPACNQCNGAAIISALGGTLPYSYVWTTGAATSSVSNLCAGLYQVQITDNLGCQQTQNVIINNSNGITGYSFNVQDEVCATTCNGSATITAVGGTAPISYNWINPVIANPVATNLCAGNYFVQMTDANGCILTASTTVNSTPGFTFTPSIQLPDCGLSNGSIAVTVVGGLPPYTYSWMPGGSTSSVITGVGPGSYTLIINDNTSCSKTQVFNISNSSAPAVTFTQTNINCFNACTGSVSAVATGSAPPFTYNWSVGGTLPTASNLCKGVITLTVTDNIGCKAVRAFTLTDNPELELSLPNLVLPGCFGICNGAITLIPSGGVLPYTYSWTPSGGSSNPQTNICAGNYTVLITDSKGCATNASVTLNNPPPLQVSALFNNSSCSSVADGSIGVTVNGGTPAYTFTWTGPAAYTSSLQNITNLFAGTYSLNLSDVNGCLGDTVLQLVPTITITSIAGNDTIVCASAPVILNGSASQGASQYTWYQLPDMSTPAATGATFAIPGAAGSATYELLTVASVSSCVARDTVVVNVFPELIVDAGPSVIIPVFSTVTIGGNPTAPGAVSLTWTPAMYLSDPLIPNPVATNTLTMMFTVTAVDANGCFASDTMKVELYPEVKIPNGFSPNADGKNDSWIIDYIDQFPENTVEVFNRWGEQLFYSKGYGIPFNGTYRGKDLPVGTYYYIIHLNHPAYTKPYTGPLTIFR